MCDCLSVCIPMLAIVVSVSGQLVIWFVKCLKDEKKRINKNTTMVTITQTDVVKSIPNSERRKARARPTWHQVSLRPGIWAAKWRDSRNEKGKGQPAELRVSGCLLVQLSR